MAQAYEDLRHDCWPSHMVGNESGERWCWLPVTPVSGSHYTFQSSSLPSQVLTTGRRLPGRGDRCTRQERGAQIVADLFGKARRRLVLFQRQHVWNLGGDRCD